jgi:hypothetical protein
LFDAAVIHRIPTRTEVSQMSERTKRNNDDMERDDERRTGPGQGDTQERSTRTGNTRDRSDFDDDDDRDTGNRGDDTTTRRSTQNPQNPQKKK